MFLFPDFQYQPAKLIKFWLIGSYLSGIIFLFAWPGNFLFKCILFIFSLYRWLIDYKTLYAKTNKLDIVNIKVTTDDKWILQNELGDNFIATLLSHTLITNFLIILYFKINTGENITLFLLPNSLSKTKWRNLQVYLRLI